MGHQILASKYNILGSKALLKAEKYSAILQIYILIHVPYAGRNTRQCRTTRPDSLKVNCLRETPTVSTPWTRAGTSTSAGQQDSLHYIQYKLVLFAIGGGGEGI